MQLLVKMGGCAIVSIEYLWPFVLEVEECSIVLNVQEHVAHFLGAKGGE
jgi:hypothetical protein